MACEDPLIGRTVVTALSLLALAFAAPTGAAPPRAPAAAPAVVAGRSALGRPLEARRRGPAVSLRRVLVVGCVHGDECAGVAVARWLEQARPQAVQLWVIENLNPDGYAAGTRGNARGVDLNRNFPWRWRALDPRGGPHYSGRHALSEPESRFAASLIERVRPVLTIWFHQPLGLVDDSGGRVAVERGYAGLVGLPFVRLARYPGSAASWQNHLYPSTAFVVELPRGALSAPSARRYGEAILALAARLDAAGGLAAISGDVR